MTRRFLFLLSLLGASISACSSGAPPRPSMLADAESLYWRSEFDSARTIWDSALVRARAENDTATEAISLTWLGLVAWRTGELEDARRMGETALALKQRSNLKAELWRSHNALAVLALSEDRLVDALVQAERAVAAARAVGNADGELRANMNRALVHAYLGEYGRARDEFEAAYQGARRGGDLRVQANALANLAMVHIGAGSTATAIAKLDSARALYRQIDYLPGEQNALGQLATAYEAAGNYGRSIIILDSARVLARDHAMREQELEALRLLGGVYERAGDLPHAFSYLEQARTLGRELDLPGEIGNTLRSEARARLSLGMTARAYALADSARMAHRAAGEAFDELDDLILIAEIHMRRDDRAAARSSLDQARNIAETLESSAAARTVMLAEARFAKFTGQSSKVLELLRKQSTAEDPISDPEANSLAAHSFRALGLRDSAIAAGYRAIRALDLVRAGLPDALSARYVDSRASIYGDLIVTLLENGRGRDAFQVADAARSKGLVENLVQVGEQLARSPGDRSLLERERLLRRIDELLQRLGTLERTPRLERGAAHTEAAQQLSERLGQARSEYERLLMRDNGSAASASVAGATLESVQKLLQPSDVLLEYFFAGDRAQLFVVTSKTLRTVRLNDFKSWLPRLRILRETWGRPNGDWRVGVPFARVLYTSLLAPALSGLALPRNGQQTLFIVPHGVLAQVPYAALVSPQGDRFVAQDYAVAVLPSASALVSIRQRAVPTRLSAGSAFAPFPPQLPATAAEVAAVQRSAEAVVFKSGEATESRVRAQLQQSLFVHLASHGILNALNPMFSRIELARRAGGASSDDGRLEVHEVTGLSIRSRLVFLSGCETGAAREWVEDPVRGAAYMTLAQAFLFAGARTVVATLWPISDQGAADFARDFYQALRRETASESLARAQRSAINDPRRSNPYYWAGYVLHGDGADRVLTQNRSVASVLEKNRPETPASLSRSNR